MSVFHLTFWSDALPTGLHSHPTAHYTDVIVTDQQITLYKYYHSQTALSQYYHSKTTLYQYCHSKPTLYQYYHSKTTLYQYITTVKLPYSNITTANLPYTSITTAKLPYTLVTPYPNYHISHISTYLGLVGQFLFMFQCLFIFFFRSYGFHLGGEADSFLTHLVLLQSRVEAQMNA